MQQLFHCNVLACVAQRLVAQVKEGKGSIFIDENGKEYIDFSSGIGTNVFGACDDLWKEAVINQVNTVQHTSNLYYSEPQTKVAKLLCKKTNMKKVFFANSGAEANECAIKTARKYSFDKYIYGRTSVRISLHRTAAYLDTA